MPQDTLDHVNLDTITNCGIYRLQENITGVPTTMDYNQLLVVNGQNSDTIFQILFQTSSNEMYFRGRFGYKNPWNSWQRVAASAELMEHTNNINNPHNVTAEQTGAIPKNILGVDPIQRTSDDTVENWSALGNGMWWFDRGDCLINQPHDYGFLVNMVCGGGVAQMFYLSHNMGVYYRFGSGEAWHHDFTKLVNSTDLAGYLPLKGGVLQTDGAQIYTRNGTGSLYTDGNTVSLTSFANADKDENNRRSICLRNKKYEGNISHSLVLEENIDNQTSYYNIFGQHNTALLANTIENLMQTGEVRTLDETTKATLSSIEQAVQKNYGEAQQEGADAIMLELLERGVL